MREKERERKREREEKRHNKKTEKGSLIARQKGLERGRKKK